VAIHVLMINEQASPSEFINTLSPKEFIIHKFSGESEYLSIELTFDLDVIIIDTSDLSQNKMLDYKNIRKLSQAPILVLSNIDKPGIVEKVLDSGADDFILKPVSPILLRSRLKALARRSHHLSMYHSLPQAQQEGDYKKQKQHCS